MRRRYGEALYRVPLDLGLGCPNRDPVNGRGGCSFCAGDGGRAQQISGIANLQAQADAGIHFARRRYGARKFMLYLQAYTATFTSADKLKESLHTLLNEHQFTVVSFGTRPDCLNEEIIEFLLQLNELAEVWVELGVQTSHDNTLARINRGHDWACSEKMIRHLTKQGLRVAPHVIIGLPGENSSHWNRTAQRLAKLPVSAVKIHNLHVLKDTALAEEYAADPFPVLNEHQYTEAIIEFLRRLPPDLPVMRLTTDSPDEKLIAPRWEMPKGRFLTFLQRQMKFRNVSQGDLLEKQSRKNVAEDKFIPLTTDDGSFTFWSDTFKEHYHSKVGARTEAETKYVEPSGLRKKLEQGPVKLLDVCFGMGYNSLAACEAATATKSGYLQVTALEIDVTVVTVAGQHLQTPSDACLNWNELISELAVHGHAGHAPFSIELLLGDARAKLDRAGENGPFDIVFLDPFSTQRNAELWTLDFFRRLKTLLTERGLILTYCAALPVRGGLLQAGFSVGETPAAGRKRGGTIAAIQTEDITSPLSREEITTIRETARGLPYRDPSQVSTNRQILRRREETRRA